MNKIDSNFICFILHKMWYKKIPMSELDPSYNQEELQYRIFKRDIHKVFNMLLHHRLVDKNCLILSLIYMYKIQCFYQSVYGSECKFCDLFQESDLMYKFYMVCLVLSQKWLTDNSSTLKTWNIVSGIRIDDLKNLEYEILKMLDFNLTIPASEFDLWKTKCTDNFGDYLKMTERKKQCKLDLKVDINYIAENKVIN